MSHATVQFSLNEEGNQKPVDTYHTIMRALVEEQNDGNYDGKGSFKDHSHILEEGENEFQVYIFELDEL